MRKKTKMSASSMVKTIYFGGTFDIISWAHCKSFELCKTFGNYLIVGLNTDKLIRSYKQREPLYPYDQKKFVIENLKWVDKVIPVHHFSPMEILQDLKPDVYVVGSEFEDVHKKEIAFVKSYGGEVRVSPEWKGAIHTSEIKRKLLAEAQNHKVKD